jgi:predicted nuclease of predicted toxin-antitoxin system
MDAILVTSAADFDDLVILESDAGRVLRLDVGPCSTDAVEARLREVAGDLPELFVAHRQVTLTR